MQIVQSNLQTVASLCIVGHPLQDPFDWFLTGILQFRSPIIANCDTISANARLGNCDGRLKNQINGVVDSNIMDLISIIDMNPH